MWWVLSIWHSVTPALKNPGYPPPATVYPPFSQEASHPHPFVRVSWQLGHTHVYSWVEGSGTMRVKRLTQKHNAMMRPSLIPVPLDLQSNSLQATKSSPIGIIEGRNNVGLIITLKYYYGASKVRQNMFMVNDINWLTEHLVKSNTSSQATDE